MTDQERHFQFLNDLRDSGRINMWASAKPLSDAFELDIKEAQKIVTSWMKSFKRA